MSQLQTQIFPIRTTPNSTCYRYQVIVTKLDTDVNSDFKGIILNEANRNDEKFGKSVSEERKAAYRVVVEEAFKRTECFGVKDMVYVYDGFRLVLTNKPVQCGSVLILNDQIPSGCKSVFNRKCNLKVILEEQEVFQLKLNDLLCFATNGDTVKRHLYKSAVEMITSAFAIGKRGYKPSKDGNHLTMSQFETKERVGDGRCIIPGCTKSFLVVSPTGGLQMALSLDPSKNVYYKPGNLLDIVNKEIVRGKNCDVKQVIGAITPNNILGVLLETTHRKNGDIFKLKAFSTVAVSKLKIDGKELLSSYFKRKYNVDIKYPNYPAVLIRVIKTIKNKDGEKEKIEEEHFYPMETLKIHSGRQPVPVPKMDSTSAKTQMMINTAGPVPRFAAAKEQFVSMGLNDASNVYLKGFGLTIDSTPMSVGSDRVPVPQIMCGKIPLKVFDSKHDGNKGVKRFTKGAIIEELFVACNGNVGVVNQFIKDYVSKAGAHGVTIKKVNGAVDVNTSDTGRLEAQLKSIVKNPKGFLVVVDDKRVDSHKALKVFEQKNDILTQHISMEIARVAASKFDTMTNIIRKTNIKNGGQCDQVMVNAGLKDHGFDKTLYLGFDLTVGNNPQNMGYELFNSVGWSANIGGSKGQFIGDYWVQDRNASDVGFLMDGEIMRMALIRILSGFRKFNGNLPERIVVFRSGINQVEYGKSLEIEVVKFKSVIEEARSVFKFGKPINFTWVFVNKAHNIRFYSSDKGQVENVRPGTFVSKAFSRPGETQFFSKTSAPTKGTGKLAYYDVGFDGLKLTTEKMEEIVNLLAYCHDIIPASVSLVSPTYQAQENAKRANNNTLFMQGKGVEQFLQDGNFAKISETLNYSKKTLGALRFNA
uniref:Piwi domain-containing protein n=1 Tax=Rhabditophanes sp. KR3021 TaxID=114890 RepID=A0AC35UIL0_9BILA